MIKARKAGMRVGKLTILSLDGRYYVCICDCGREKKVGINRFTPSFLAKNSHVEISCGCIPRAYTSRKTHGHSFRNNVSSEYLSWNGMKARCYNEKTPSYHRYGGRGISICDRWINSFSNFLKDMGKKPSDNYSIDRIDNDGNYSPENCRWATNKMQVNNSTGARLLTYKNETLCCSDWAKKIGISLTMLLNRLKKGDSIEDIINEFDKFD